MENKKLRFNKDYLYILPAVVFIMVFFVTSIVFTLYLSFFDWNGIGPMKFIGLSNYMNLFKDSNFLISVYNTIAWVIGSLIVNMFVPLVLSIFITRSYCGSLFKNIFYLPNAFSLTVGGMIITTLLMTGGIPSIAAKLGHPELVFDWLSIPYVNTYVMIIMTTWQGIGLNRLLFVGGLRSVDESPVEAATIDGAGPIKIYTRVILPMLKPIILVVFIMSMVNSFKIFDNIWIMTKGGPYRTSETLALTMYTESFVYNRYGSGAAVAVILSLIVSILAIFNLRLISRKENVEMIVKNNISKIVVTFVLLLLAIIWIIPIIFVFINLFKTRIEYNMGSFWSMPKGNAFIDNFKYLLSGLPIFKSMRNGFIYALCGASISLVCGVLAAYGISHLKIKYPMFWFMFIYTGTIFPFQLYLIPIYRAYMNLNLYDTRIGIILFYSAICIPFIMFVMRNNFIRIDREICESAKIEGASDMQILTRLFVPMTTASLSIVFLTQFSWCWNDLMFGLTLLRSETKQTVMPFVSLMDKGNAPVLFMVCIVVSIPTIGMFSFLQKNTESGMIYTSK